MFYQEIPERALRFGDVVRGLPALGSLVEAPLLEVENSAYQLQVQVPPFSVILTPCCTIRQSVISVCPLRKIDIGWLRNPYFVDDFERINHKLTAENTLPPESWEKISPEEKQRRRAEGPAYALLPQFVYGPHALLPQYTLEAKGTQYDLGHYMIDFRDSFKVRLHRALPEVKCLQLSVRSRQSLRDKIADYYGRVPEEDRVLLSG